MRQFTSVVADIKLESRQGLSAIWRMTLDDTEFEPGNTGILEAITRSGTRLQILVTAVVEDAEGLIWHVVEKPLAAGTDVRCIIV